MDPDLLVVKTFANRVEADLALTALDAAGILAAVRADDCAGQRPHLSFLRVAIVVRPEDLARAQDVLNETATPAEPAPESE